MPVEVIMPKVDMDMVKGSVTAWLVEEGAEVKAGDPLFEIETDKAAMEVESPGSGRLFNIVASPGEDVPVGTPVAWIYEESEEVGPPPVAAAGPATMPSPQAYAAPTREAEAVAAPPSNTGAVRATPLARRLARDSNIDLTQVAGSGPKGRVQSADVARYADQPGHRTEKAAPSPITLGGSAEPPLSVIREGGTDGAPLFLIHGLTADVNAWARLIPLLPAGRPILNLELPAHGRSPRLSVRTLDALVASVLAAFDIGVGEPVHLIGHSLGGAVATVVADLRPDRVASLTLIAPAGLGPEIDGAAIAGVARASRVESLAPWLKRFTADPERISWNYAAAAMLARDDPALRTAQSDMIEALLPDSVQGFDITAVLNRLRPVTRIIWGRADKIIPWSQALQAPGTAALHLLKDVGHLPHFEAPDVVAKLIDEQIASTTKIG